MRSLSVIHRESQGGPSGILIWAIRNNRVSHCRVFIMGREESQSGA